MNYEEAKQRSDYKFSVNIPEYLLAELKADWLNSFAKMETQKEVPQYLKSDMLTLS